MIEIFWVLEDTTPDCCSFYWINRNLSESECKKTTAKRIQCLSCHISEFYPQACTHDAASGQTRHLHFLLLAPTEIVKIKLSRAIYKQTSGSHRYVLFFFGCRSVLTKTTMFKALWKDTQDKIYIDIHNPLSTIWPILFLISTLFWTCGLIRIKKRTQNYKDRTIHSQ